MHLADEHLVTRLAIDTRGDLDQIRTAVERLRVVAAEALDAVFSQAMSREIGGYFAGDVASVTRRSTRR